MSKKFSKYSIIFLLAMSMLAGCSGGETTEVTTDPTTQQEQTDNGDTSTPTVDPVEEVIEIDYSKKLILAEYLVGTAAQKEIQEVIDQIEPNLAEPPKDTLTMAYIGYEYNDDVTYGDTGLCVIGTLMNGYDVPVQNIKGELLITDENNVEVGTMDIEMSVDSLGVVGAQQSRVMVFTMPTNDIIDNEVAKALSDAQAPLFMYLTYECESVEPVADGTEENQEPTTEPEPDTAVDETTSQEEDTDTESDANQE